MHKKRIFTFIWVMAACMLVLVCYFVLKVESPLRDHIIFSETVHGLTIEPYYDETDDMYYLFLPAYINEDDIQIKRDGFVQVDFADENEDYGNSLGEVPLCEDVTLTIKNFGRIETYTYQIWQSENLPTIYLETESGSLDYVNEDKENEEQVSVVIINADDSIEYNGIGVITGRGNSTWKGAKKPYNLKFDKEVSLFGNDRASTWCLLANYIDTSQIRNALCYYAARMMGIEYTSDMEFVSLFVNGEYMGLYNVATKQNYRNGIGSSINAVFDIRDSGETYDYITERGTHIREDYGEEKYIYSTIETFEEALFNEEDFQVIEQYIDVSSLARKYCAETFFANADNKKSQYFAINKEGKITAICAWDYDHAFGISPNKYFDTSYNQFNIELIWYQKLFQYEEFKEAVISCFYKNKMLFQNSLIDFMDNCCSIIENDWNLNFTRWNNEQPYFEEIYSLKCDSIDINSLEGQRKYISEFIENRIQFLEDYWDAPELFCIFTFSDDIIGEISIYCKRGEIFSESMLPDGLLKIPDAGFLGWYTEDGLNVTDVEIVTEDMIFYGKWEKSPAEQTLVSEINGNSKEGKDFAYQTVSEQDILEESKNSIVATNVKDDNLKSPVELLKKIYHFFGFEFFERKELALIGVFALVLIILLITDLIRVNKQRR